MKQILILLLIVSSAFISNAQVDSAKIEQTITLSLDKICFIKNCIGNNGDPSYVKFYKQVSNQIDTSAYNASQQITVTVPSDFVITCYVAVSNVSERLSNPINDEISQSLLPQLSNPWLLLKLQAITVASAMQRASMIQSGFTYFKQIK